MADIIVSNPVDTFMRSDDQTELRSSLGLGTAAVRDESYFALAGETSTTVDVINLTEGRSLTLSDLGKYLRVNSPSNEDIIVPHNSIEAFELGSIITIRHVGEGDLTLVPSVGVTLLGGTFSQGQGRSLQLVKVGINTWDVIGAA